MEKNCTLLLHYDLKGSGTGVAPTEDEIRTELESRTVENKVRGMKTLILLLLNGQNLPKLLMTVIRYCVTTRDHELKKLLCIYWEIVQKVDAQGKPLSEMLLVCNSLLQNLEHPNHYVRGLTLRFLIRATSLFHSNSDLLQPLLPPIIQSLTHQEQYVRKYALLALISFSEEYPDVLADESDGSLIFEVNALLESETDKPTRRNAFILLSKIQPNMAMSFYVTHMNEVSKYGQDFHFALLKFIKETVRSDSSLKSKFIRTLFDLLSQREDNAIVYEAAYTLTLLSSAPTAARAACEAYLGILNDSESDNNVKLIVLQRLEELKVHATGEVMEIARVMKTASTGVGVKSTALKLVLKMLNKRSVTQVANLLKDILKSMKPAEEDEGFRKELINGIHMCVVQYPEIVSSNDQNEIISTLISLLASDSSNSSNVEIMILLREIVESFTDLRQVIVEKLIVNLPEVNSVEVIRVLLWILGEYLDESNVEEVWEGIFEAVGALPLAPNASSLNEEISLDQAQSVQKSTVTVLEDGTYATQTAVETKNSGFGETEADQPGLRKLILSGNYLAGTCTVSALMKIILKLRPKDNAKIVKLVSFALNLLELGQSKDLPQNLLMSKDDYERINLYIKVLMDTTVAGSVQNVLANEGRKHLQDLITKTKFASLDEEEIKPVQPDARIEFRQLSSGGNLGLLSSSAISEEDQISIATQGSGTVGGYQTTDSFKKELESVHQLTGFSDAVYCEANVQVHAYDILLDFLLINRSDQTLVDLCVELGTLGDSLQLVDRPESVNIPAGGCVNVKASVKVKSTESGQIFGTISYDQSASINLNYISIDIMDYINPADCSDDHFRSMWAEFEWENKVTVSTSITDVYQFLDHLVRSTNMKCLNIEDLTKEAKLRSESKQIEEVDFLVANLYAQSVFGEDALVNVSIENVEGKVEGHIRIRAKTQGIALSLGDKINSQQKKLSKESIEILGVHREL